MRFSLFIFFILFFGCGKEGTKKVEINEKEILKNFQMFHSSGGQKLWEVVSSEAICENDKIYLKDYNVKFFDNKKCTGTINAKEGIIDLSNNNFSTIGKAEITSLKGEKIISRDIYYDSKLKKILGNNKVKFIKKNTVIEGDGFEISPDFSKVVIKKNIARLK